MQVRALLWSGSADDYIDLQAFLPEPWNVSQALDLDVDGDTLRVLGTAQQATHSNGYEMNAGEQPVLWTMKLRVVEAPARRELPPEVQSSGAPSASEMSDERRIEQAAERFANAVIANDYGAAHAVLAPWLGRQVTPETLETILAKQFLADSKAVDFVISGNDSTLEELREHYEEYYKGDATRTLASVEEFGDWGPPSIHIDAHVTSENFRGWMSIDLTPELDDPSGLDYLLRLWLIVVDVGGAMQIGYLEPGQ